MSRSTIPAPAHRPGEKLHGFVIDQVTELPDIKALAYEAHHEKTGARVLAVHCNDEENMFSVGFRTPPTDSTGVAHILEHCVLAGSDQFPVKDAFNELGKRTLSTFLNAMTWPDRTIYPTSSAVKADYFNLARVYSDLVFHPRISEQTFRQEGHHLELEDPENPGESPLIVSGVVYNEMKGAYSAPESLVYRSMQQELLPDSTYGVDSGGDPETIPDLTYEQFREFHRRYYSPSNARFMLYGDVPVTENLEFLSGVLAPFERVEVDSAVRQQTRWTRPRTVEETYPVGKGDSLDGKTFVTLSWMVNDTTDVIEALLMEVLMSALAGTAAGPLRRALIDSGLGKDVFPPAAFEADMLHTMVMAGLRGTDPDKAEAVETLIVDTLREVADKGLDPELIEASFHQIELGGKEIVPPFPIMLLVRANPTWYFDADPKAGLQFATLVEQARERYAAEPDLMQTLIRKWLLDNPHRLRLVMRPSATLADEQEKAFRDRMAAKKSGMTPEQVQAVATEAAALKAEQEAPDTPEALATLPKLDIADIPREPRTIPAATRETGGVEVIEHEVFSNGIAYVGLSFDMRDLTDGLAPWVPLMARATTGMGAAGLSFDRMATRIAQHTGGFSISPAAGEHVDSGARFETLTVDGNMLGRNVDEAFSILRDLLTAPDPTDHKRLRDLIREMASRKTSRLIPAGHSFAMMRAAASLGPSQWRREQWEGSTQVRFANELATKDDETAAARTIAALQKQLFTRARVSVHLAGDPELLACMRGPLEGLLQALPAGEPVSDRAPGKPATAPHGGVIIPAQVNYVAQVVPVPTIAHEAAPALELLAQFLSNEFLYKKLRVQGGAYGGFGRYGAESGSLALGSYRDPQLTQTWQVYSQIADFLKSDALTDDAIESVRIGAIGSIDRILSPGQQLAVARGRRMLGITDEIRSRFRQGLFAATAGDIREKALPHIEKALADAPRAALAPRERLEAANRELGGILSLESIEPGG